jgi:hypothetical protein
MRVWVCFVGGVVAWRLSLSSHFEGKRALAAGRLQVGSLIFHQHHQQPHNSVALIYAQLACFALEHAEPGIRGHRLDIPVVVRVPAVVLEEV